MKTIKDWALDDRPREKMIAKGAESLSNAELMAILIGSGIPGISAVDLMRQILGDYNDSLKLLGKATVEDLTRYKGNALIACLMAVIVIVLLEIIYIEDLYCPAYIRSACPIKGKPRIAV